MFGEGPASSEQNQGGGEDRQPSPQHGPPAGTHVTRSRPLTTTSALQHAGRATAQVHARGLVGHARDARLLSLIASVIMLIVQIRVNRC